MLRLPAGLELLGKTKLAANAASSAVVTIAARELLFIIVNVAGYTGSGTCSLRFNADSGANYNSYYMSYASGSAFSATTAQVSQSLLRLGSNATANARQAMVSVQNLFATSHPAVIQSITASAANTAPIVSSGGGTWTSAAAAQITSVQLVLPEGVSLLAGTSMAIYGSNPT